MIIEPEISGVSIVLVGSFNPLIFKPEWFGEYGLFTEKEVKASEIEVVYREISIFEMDWLSLRVEQQRLIAETKEAPYIRLQDLIVRTFKEFLSHTPIGMMGINHSVHFRVNDEALRNNIGKLLAPHETWGEWGKKIEGGDAEKRGGVRSLIMQQKDLDDRPSGHIQVKIEPSTKLVGNTGIFMETNDHYEVEDPKEVVGCEEIIKLLEGNFQTSIQRSEAIINGIMAYQK